MVERKRSSTYPSIDKPWESGHSFFDKNPIIPNTSIYRLLKLLCMGKKDKTSIEYGNNMVRFFSILRKLGRKLVIITVWTKEGFSIYRDMAGEKHAEKSWKNYYSKEFQNAPNPICISGKMASSRKEAENLIIWMSNWNHLLLWIKKTFGRC